MGIGIFIQPKGELKDNILSWKSRVKEKLVTSSYCSHPPHSTLIHTNVASEVDAQREIRKAIKSFSRFFIKTEGTSVFWNDGAAEGGHTLIWKLQKTREICDLQFLVAEALRPIWVRTAMPDYVKNSDDCIQSFNLYGFPFVGSHWIPHMTIASLKTESDDVFIENFLSQAINFTIEVDEVSCWRTDRNDQHVLLDRIELS